jgi:hypothetical protein
MSKYLFYNDLRTAQATSLSADFYGYLSLYFFPFTQKITPIGIVINLVASRAIIAASHANIIISRVIIVVSRAIIVTSRAIIVVSRAIIVTSRAIIVVLRAIIVALRAIIVASRAIIVALRAIIVALHPTRLNLGGRGAGWGMNRQELNAIIY